MKPSMQFPGLRHSVALALLGSLTFTAGLVRAGTAFASSSLSWPNVVGIGTTDSDYAMNRTHTAYATVTVTMGSRQVTASGSAIGSVTVYAYMPLFDGSAWEDGYVGVTNVSKEYCPVVMAYFTDGSPTYGSAIDPYVYMSSVSWSPSAIALDGAKSKVTVTAGKSQNCGDTDVMLQVNLRPIPTTLVYTAPLTQLQARFTNNIAPAPFEITSGPDNHTAGSIHADGLLTAAGCAVDGNKSKANAADLRVQ